MPEIGPRDSDKRLQRTERHRRVVTILADRFRLSRPARPVIFLGAGASVSSGVPAAAEAVKRIARLACAREVFGTNDVSRVKVGDYMRFLHSKLWFDPDPARLPENFPAAVKHLLNPREDRREFFMRELRPSLGLSSGYRALARMVQRGLWRTALTTNFDTCLADALAELGPHLHQCVEVNRIPGDTVQLNLFRREPQIVYLHGAVEAYSDQITDDEVRALAPRLVQQLLPLLRDSPVIVVGYRGAEPSVMDGLFGALLEDTQRFRSGLFWATLSNEALHPRVAALADMCGGNFFPLEIDGFDELFEDLNAALADEDAASNAHLRSGDTEVAPDECVLKDLTLDDLDKELMIATLTEYCREVGRPAVDRESVVGLLLEQGLAVRIGQTVHPTLSGFALFGRDVQRVFPQASVELTVDGRKRQWFRGNLLQQFRELTDQLNAPEINRELRIKTERGATRKRAYHPRALTELTVNLLVHRDYHDPRPALIEIEQGVAIRFTNPGGLLPEVARQVGIDKGGVLRPKRSVTAQRNAAIADVFFGLRSMDKRGSGLCDAIEYMRDHGGDARFTVEANNSGFVAELLQARQGAPHESETAVPLHPFGVYVTNHLPFAALPRTVTVAPLEARPRLRRYGGADLLQQDGPADPIFVQQRDRIVSFARPSTLFLGRGDESTVDLDYFASLPGGRSALSWLLRKHVVKYLRRFVGDGLYVEPGGHRAYFVKTNEERQKIIYDGAKRKGLEREVVKRRELVS